jgi:hypothetical protein
VSGAVGGMEANDQHNPATPSTEAMGLHSQPAQPSRPARRCEIRRFLRNRLVLTSGMVQHLDRVERVRRRQPKPARRTGRERDAGPGARRRARARSRRLVVDGESFVVTRRADSPGTYDFDWISHPASYGFTIGANFEWRPDQAELREEIHHFLADVDPKTGYLPD